MKFIYLNAADMAASITMDDAIQSNKEALLAYAENEADIPMRMTVPVDDYEGAALFMPGLMKPTDALGVKIVSVYENNPAMGLDAVPATMILLDAETGYLKGIMDGTTLTRIRTGALAGAATDLLAKKDAKTFLLIGTGGQAESQLEAILTVRSIEEVFVYSRNQDKRKDFAKKMQEKFSTVRITAVDDLERAVRAADIITTVTTTNYPVLEADWVQEGTHINGMGSYATDMQELPADLYTKADLVYVDTYDAVAESGDFKTPMNQGTFGMDVLTGMLGKMIAEEKPGRENDEQITIFKSTGNAVFDVAVADEIYNAAIEKNIGTWIE